MISGLEPVSFFLGKRSAPLPGPLQGCFPRKKAKGPRSSEQIASLRAPPRSVPRPRPRRLPWRCLIDSARRRRAAGAALAAEKREEAAHLLVVPASSRPDVLRLFRRWGLVAGGFGRCFPGGSGSASGRIKKSGAARLEFVCFLPWAQVLCAPENFAVSLQQTLVFSSFVVGGSLLFTCRLFPLSPFPEAAKSQKALGAAHEQQGLRPARATRTRRATASAATKATGKHRQQSSREKQLGEQTNTTRGSD